MREVLDPLSAPVRDVPMTGKPRRVSLSLQKRSREHDSDSVKAKKPRRFELGMSKFVGRDAFEDEN